jgi:hypothetical protein
VPKQFRDRRKDGKQQALQEKGWLGKVDVVERRDDGGLEQ